MRTLFRVVTVVALPGDVADTRRDNARRHRVAKGALPANEPAEAVAVAVAVALPRRTWLQRVARIVAEVVGRCHVAFADELVSAIVGAAATAEMWRHSACPGVNETPRWRVAPRPFFKRTKGRPALLFTCRASGGDASGFGHLHERQRPSLVPGFMELATRPSPRVWRCLIKHTQPANTIFLPDQKGGGCAIAYLAESSRARVGPIPCQNIV